MVGEEKRKTNKEGKERKEGGRETNNRHRVSREREKKAKKKSFSFLSKIYGDRAVGFRRSKR